MPKDREYPNNGSGSNQLQSMMQGKWRELDLERTAEAGQKDLIWAMKKFGYCTEGSKKYKWVLCR